MEKPTIELRKISTNQRLSEETHCYTADLYVDGVKWGEVGNRGHGGADHFYGVNGRNYNDIRDLNERIKATYPKEEFRSGDETITIDMDLEILCAELVNAHLRVKTYKRLAAKNILFFKAGRPPEGQTADLYTIALKGRDAAALAASLKAKQPEAFILNTLPEAEAIAAYGQAN